MGSLAHGPSGHLNAAGFKDGGPFTDCPGCQTSRATNRAKPKVHTVASTSITRENSPTRIMPMIASRSVVISPPTAASSIEVLANTFVSAGLGHLCSIILSLGSGRCGRKCRPRCHFILRSSCAPQSGRPLAPECPLGSVHARLRSLQAINRQETRVKRPHRPAARSGPKRLAMREAAEPLRRSSGLVRLEGPITPKTMRRFGTVRNNSCTSNLCREHHHSLIHI